MRLPLGTGIAGHVATTGNNERFFWVFYGFYGIDCNSLKNVIDKIDSITNNFDVVEKYDLSSFILAPKCCQGGC